MSNASLTQLLDLLTCPLDGCSRMGHQLNLHRCLLHWRQRLLLTNNNWDQCVHWWIFTHDTRSCARLDDEGGGFVEEAVECGRRGTDRMLVSKRSEVSQKHVDRRRK